MGATFAGVASSFYDAFCGESGHPFIIELRGDIQSWGLDSWRGKSRSDYTAWIRGKVLGSPASPCGELLSTLYNAAKRVGPVPEGWRLWRTPGKKLQSQR